MAFRLELAAICTALVACAPTPHDPQTAELPAQRVERPYDSAVPPAEVYTQPALRPTFNTCVEAAGGATWPTQDCIEAEYAFQDGRLNRAYQALMKILPPQAQSQLRLRQRAWIRERDQACPWNDDTRGQGRRLESNYCAMARTAVRATELEQELKPMSR